MDIADTLEMDHGKEMMQMVCTSYESPQGDDMEEDYDFSMLSSAPKLLLCT